MKIAIDYSGNYSIGFVFPYSEIIMSSIKDTLMHAYNNSDIRGFVSFCPHSPTIYSDVKTMINEESKVLLLIYPYPFNLSQVFDGIPEEQIHVRKYEEFLFFNLSKQG